MEKIVQQELFKGELMEEKLRIYFLNNGYYVTRGVKYSFKGNEITDIDLLLYGRVSTLSRELTNVDIKNKKSPKAFERILWTKGVQQLLGFDSCVVATMDRKEAVREFANKHNITLLDGNFLQKLNYELTDRISEEELLSLFSNHFSYKTFNRLSWKDLYEQSKSRLLDELDFSGYNTNLILLKYFAYKCLEPQKQDVALRIFYIFLSHNLLTLDYIMKDISFLQPEERKLIIENGLKYGNFGKEGIYKTIEMAVKISGTNKNVSQIKTLIDSKDVELLKDFFSRQEIIKNLFKMSLKFEELAFAKTSAKTDALEPEIKSIIAIFLDYFGIVRKKFFEI